MKKNKKQQISALAFMMVMGISPAIVLAGDPLPPPPEDPPPCELVETKTDEGVLDMLFSYFGGDDNSSDLCGNSQM